MYQSANTPKKYQVSLLIEEYREYVSECNQVNEKPKPFKDYVNELYYYESKDSQEIGQQFVEPFNEFKHLKKG